MTDLTAALAFLFAIVAIGLAFVAGWRLILDLVADRDR